MLRSAGAEAGGGRRGPLDPGLGGLYFKASSLRPGVLGDAGRNPSPPQSAALPLLPSDKRPPAQRPPGRSVRGGRAAGLLPEGRGAGPGSSPSRNRPSLPRYSLKDVVARERRIRRHRGRRGGPGSSR